MMKTDKQEQIAQDRALAQRVGQRDARAFQCMYREYAPKLLRRLLDLLGGNQAEAEDCLQMVFVKCYQYIQEYRGEGTLLGWLHRIATNVVLDRFRAQQRWHVALQSMVQDNTVEQGPSQPLPDRLFLQEELKQIVHRTLEKMDYRKRMAILLCDFEGLSIQEAATEMSVSMGTIGSRLHNGRKELRRRLISEGKRSGTAMEEWLHV